ncbi:MAG: phospholipid carrier-dependent glycosyltransferase [Planctomycetota bacterium]
MDLAWYQFPLVLATPVLLGIALLRCARIGPAVDRLAYAAWAYVAGMMGTATLLFLWLCLGLPLNAWLLQLFLLGTASFCFFISRTPREHEVQAHAMQSQEFPLRERAFFVGALVLVLLATCLRIMDGNSLPVADGDEALVWATKAKLIHSSESFGQQLAENVSGLEHGPAFADAFTVAIEKGLRDPELAQNRMLLDAPRTAPDHHLDYPVLNPLLQVWIFAHAEGQTEWENRLPIQGFALALLLVLAAGLRRVLRPAIVALCLIVFAVMDETVTQTRTCYADVMVAVGVAIACDAWLRGQQQRDGPWRWLVLLGLSVAAWTKNEGMMYLCVALVAGLLACWQRLPGKPSRNLFEHRAGILVIPFLFVGATLSLNFAFGFTNELVGSDATGTSFFERLLDQQARVAAIAEFTFDELLLSRDRCFVFLGFLVLLVLCPVRAVTGPQRAPGLFLVFAMLGILTVYLATPSKIYWHLATSAPRVVWQLAPCVLLWMAYLMREPLAVLKESLMRRSQ